MNKEWRPVLGYEGLYEVSNYGEVKSLTRKRSCGKGFYYQEERILKQTFTTTGYKKVELSKDGKRKSLKVHRLVAIAFIPNPFNKEEVNHIDGDKINNNVNNLEWVTSSENSIHAIKTGLKKIKYNYSKELLYDMYVTKNMTMADIARELGIDAPSVKRCLVNNGFKIKSLSSVKTKYNIDIDYILEQLKYRTQKDLAEEIGCDPSLISKYIKEKGNNHNGK
jgi:Mn-dependent DtxR family transcriptional regulator